MLGLGQCLERLQMPGYRFFHVLDTSKTSDYLEGSSRGVGEGWYCVEKFSFVPHNDFTMFLLSPIKA